MAELFPLGVRRDGSYYTRIEWTDHTETDPLLWVGNIIDDDIERNGGTWGSNTYGPSNLVLSFFGEEQEISRIRLYRNVGVTISVIEELCKTVRIYYSNTDDPRKLRSKEDKIDDVAWTPLCTVTTDKSEGWQEVPLEAPIRAKYLRFELVENHGTPIDWVELSEIKIYP